MISTPPSHPITWLCTFDGRFARVVVKSWHEARLQAAAIFATTPDRVIAVPEAR